jgi:DNA-binding SARP family transcriptional activator
MSLLLQSEEVLQFRILGPLEVANASGLVELGGPRQRSLLAVLLLRANEIVSTDSLLHAIWGEHPPRTAPAALQNGISQLRKLLGADAVETRPPGYRLHVLPEQIDVVQFEQLVHLARGQAAEDRAQTLARALALWRGQPLADLTFEDFAQTDIHRLTERRLQVRMERLEAELECGRHADAVPELEGLVKTHPLHEGLTNQLIVALYRCGRFAEALEVYETGRRLLKSELGAAPSQELRTLHAAILRHDPSLQGPASPSDRDRLPSVRAMLASRLVPVLGPGLSGSAPAPDPAAAAQHLSERFGCPAQYAGSLARVGQVDLRHAWSRPAVRRVARALRGRFRARARAPLARRPAGAPASARTPVPAVTDLRLRSHARARARGGR